MRGLVAACLQVCLAFFALSEAGCTQRPPTLEPLNLEGYGEIQLVGARLSEPFDAAKVQQCMKAVSDWHKGQLLVPFRVAVSPVHDLVKSIKKGPTVVILPDGQPDVAFWIPLKEGGKKILIETPSTGDMRLVAPPTGQTLDLSFASSNK